MARKCETFKVEVEGTEKEYKMYSPTWEDRKKAKSIGNEVTTEALQSKAPLRSELNKILRDRGKWSAEQEAELTALDKRIDDADKKIAAGGIKLKEAKDLALRMREMRFQRRVLLAEHSLLDKKTVEGQSEDMAFNYLVYCGLVYNDTDKRVFDSWEEFLNESESVLAIRAGNVLAGLLYGVGTDAEKKLPENEFLLEFGFCNKDLKLVNKDGHLVDREGRLINEEGFYVDKDGSRVDIDGVPLDKDGNYKLERKPFLDDDGKEIIKKEKSSPKVKKVDES
jgi:hypothetical protein